MHTLAQGVMKRVARPRAATVVLVLVCAWWGGCSDQQPERAEPTPETGPSGLYDIGARELFLEFAGAGRPVVVLEPGQGDDRATYAGVASDLADRTTVCTYDRANTGQSGTAPTPRTSLDAVEDLRALLRAAELDGPYVVAGTSAGGFIALHYARAYPSEVRGVLAINPPPLTSQWFDRAFPLLSSAEVAEEKAYYRGDNPESFDWNTSSELVELYLRLGEEYAASWPGARFEAVDQVHAVQEADPQRVVDEIGALLSE